MQGAAPGGIEACRPAGPPGHLPTCVHACVGVGVGVGDGVGLDLALDGRLCTAISISMAHMHVAHVHVLSVCHMLAICTLFASASVQLQVRMRKSGSPVKMNVHGNCSVVAAGQR
jgi:hypothetical protein